MEQDMELVCGTEDYEEIQIYIEHRKYSFPFNSQNTAERLRNEYIPEIWEVDDEEDNISNRRKTIARISRILEEIPSNSEESPIGKASFKR